MHAGTLRSLEFDRIVEAVRAYALTPMGDERLAKLGPSSDPQKVAALLAATTQTTGYLGRHGPLPLRASSELPGILGALAIEGRALEAPRLLSLAAFLDSVEDTRAEIRRAGQAFPLLDQAGSGASSFKVEVGRVREAVAPAGEVVDQASPELRAIRERLRRLRARLRTTLESYLRGKDTAKYLQDQVITERSGRYVLVVRAEHRNNIPGIVHGASTSGASLYLEPLSTVEVNNEIVALEEQETEEVRRILLQLTNGFRSRPLELQRTIEAAVELDVLQARARFSQAVDGIEPRVSTDGEIELQSARHPLLMPQILPRRAESSNVSRGADAAPAPASGPVPVTIKILPPANALLITGPNTGGKTVALKTVGLLALMAQSGLRIPASDGSRLPVFRSIFADIGDSQSIESSLSTFSAHVTNIAAMDRTLAVPALVLLDEIGSGTDPVEGGALGVALVDHFRRRGATVIATSHYDALKTYASTTAGVVTAAFGFDAETFAPTFELRYGAPGRSLALEIAARLGLSPSVIANARQNLTAREAQLAEHLAKVDHDLRALEHEQRLVARERQTLEAAEARVHQRDEALKQREELSRKRLQEELDGQLRQAKREIDGIVDGLRDKAKTAAATAGSRSALTTGDAGAMRAQAREALDAVARQHSEPVQPTSEPSAIGAQPVVGDRVVVGGLGLEAVVTGIHEGAADLDVRGKRMRASVRDLSVVGVAQNRGKVSVHVELNPREAATTDLNVIGCSVDEALARAERFLDESLLADQRVVRVIHGYGTGQLKRALSGFLQQHPLVARFEAAAPEHGGGGVTVIELKD